jgi:hypothetical protein
LGWAGASFFNWKNDQKTISLLTENQRIMGDMTLKHQLYLELEKASPEVLRQLFDFVQFLKRAEKKVSSPEGNKNPIEEFIGCMKGKEGNEFAAAIESEFNKIEGEW